MARKDQQPLRVPGTAVFMSSSEGAVPAALLNNLEHNHVLHEQVVILTIATSGVPHVPSDRRVSLERLRLGFVSLRIGYGYQDEPDVPEALRLAMQQGLAIDLEQTTYYVNHVTLIPTGETAMAGWRTWLFTLLYQNSIPAARYFRIPPDRVFEVGNYVEL